MPAKTSMLVCVVLSASLSNARADDENPVTAPGTPSTPPAAAGEGVDQMVLPKGRALLDVFAQINLSSGAVFKPFTLTPDLWYGVTPEVTVGLVHSTVGATGFMGFGAIAGDSLCLTGSTSGCEHPYRNVGFDVRYGLKKGTTPLAFDGGLFIDDFSPFQLSLKLGLAGRYESGKIALEYMPEIFIALTNRGNTTVVGARANNDEFGLPVTLLYKATPQVALSLQTGVLVPFENAGADYFVPLTLGGHYTVSTSLTLTLAFALPILTGGTAFHPAMGTDLTGVNARALIIGGAYAL
jgi:hypothetical protein